VAVQTANMRGVVLSRAVGWAIFAFILIVPVDARAADFDSSSLYLITPDVPPDVTPLYWCLPNDRRNVLIRAGEVGAEITKGRRIRNPRMIMQRLGHRLRELRARLRELRTRSRTIARRGRNVRLRNRIGNVQERINNVRERRIEIRSASRTCLRGQYTSTTAQEWYNQQLESPEDPSSPNDPGNDPAHLDPLLALIPPKDRITYALTWSSTRQEHTRSQLVRMVWVNNNNFNNRVSIADSLNSRPAGARAIFFWHPTHWPDMTGFAHEWIYYQDKNDQIRELRGVLTETGVNFTANKFRDFFQDLSQNNALLDMVILDTEQGRSNWTIGSDPDSVNHRLRWEAIEKDPRFERDVLPSLLDIGFEPSRAQGMPYLLHSVWDWENGGHNYLAWNTWRKEYESAAFSNAICNPGAEYYPDVECSNYGFYGKSPAYPIPETNGHRDYIFGSDHSVGTHQASPFYARFGNISSKFPNSPHFQKTPHNGFRYEVNRAKAMFLSSEKKSHPWVSCRNWNDEGTLFAGTDYWQELQFNLLMTGADSLVLWNPTAYQDGQHPDIYCSAEAENYMYRVLKEFDEVVRIRDIQPLTTELSPWDLPFIVTSILVNAEKGSYRITRLSTKEALQGPDSTAVITQSENGLEVTLAEHRINFPGGKLLETEDPTSEHGIWIIQLPEQGHVVTPLGDQNYSS